MDTAQPEVSDGNNFGKLSHLPKGGSQECMDLYNRPFEKGVKDTSTEHMEEGGKTYPKKRSSKIWWLPPYQLCCDF